MTRSLLSFLALALLAGCAQTTMRSESTARKTSSSADPFVNFHCEPQSPGAPDDLTLRRSTVAGTSRIYYNLFSGKDQVLNAWDVDIDNYNRKLPGFKTTFTTYILDSKAASWLGSLHVDNDIMNGGNAGYLHFVSSDKEFAAHCTAE